MAKWGSVKPPPHHFQRKEHQSQGSAAPLNYGQKGSESGSPKQSFP